MIGKQYFDHYFCNHNQSFICSKIIAPQPWKHLQKTLSWLISQAAWIWAKTGILEPDYAGAYDYDEEPPVHDDHDDHENEEKSSSPADSKDERTFNQKVLINRTRLEVCDQEVNLNVIMHTIISLLSINTVTFFILLKIKNIILVIIFIIRYVRSISSHKTRSKHLRVVTKN